MLYLFAYGTLQAGHRNHHVLSTQAVSARPGTTPGWELWHLSPNEHPAILRGTALLHGTLFGFAEDDRDEVLARCDALEDYYPDRPDESRYLRELVEVTCQDGSRVQAYIYPWNPRDAETLRARHTLLPEGDWCAFMASRHQETP